jgi:hypothetical protein
LLKKVHHHHHRHQLIHRRRVQKDRHQCAMVNAGTRRRVQTNIVKKAAHRMRRLAPNMIHHGIENLTAEMRITGDRVTTERPAHQVTEISTKDHR